MELSERLIQVKSSTKVEKGFPSYTQDDVVFFYEDVVRLVELILNHKDTSECYVLFPPAVPMQEIVRLAEDSSYVRSSMQLGLHRPSSSMIAIVSKLLQDMALEKGEEYEYIPIQALNPGGPGKHSTLKKGEEPAPTDALAYQLKQMPTQELQQIVSSLQQEMKVDRMPPWVLPIMCLQSFRPY